VAHKEELLSHIDWHYRDRHRRYMMYLSASVRRGLAAHSP
jgi:hypothetical protein